MVMLHDGSRMMVALAQLTSCGLLVDAGERRHVGTNDTGGRVLMMNISVAALRRRWQ